MKFPVKQPRELEFPGVSKSSKEIDFPKAAKTEQFAARVSAKGADFSHVRHVSSKS